MQSWDEAKRRRNLALHGLDFASAEALWDEFTVTREDLRQAYGERRWVTFGVLDSEVVVLVHTERSGKMHVLSLRRAERHEARYYIEVAQRHVGQGPGS